MKSWIAWLGIELSVVSRKEKAISWLGGSLSILLLILLNEKLPPSTGGAPLIASMGASAVLLFAVPHGQLAQPWPVLGGHVISALIGVICAKWIPYPALAAALAVGLAIGAMHQFKCIHPPGGATALTAVIGGPAIQSMEFHYVLCPVLLNAAAMITLAVLFNAFFEWRRYPAHFNRIATPPKRPTGRRTPTHEEVERALRSLDSFVDITEEDLVRLLQILTPPPETVPKVVLRRPVPQPVEMV